MHSKAATVQSYLAELPDDRRAAIQAIRQVILKNIDRQFEEGMQYGMIGYYVPHRIFPAGYHCDPRQPLPFAGLASQKNHMSLYVMSVYGGGVEEKWFRAAWARTGKKLDMGKCCIRFKKLDDLAMEVVAEAFRRVSAKGYIEHYQKAMAERPTKTNSARPAKPGAGSRPKTKPATQTAKTSRKPAKAKRAAVRSK